MAKNEGLERFSWCFGLRLFQMFFSAFCHFLGIQEGGIVWSEGLGMAQGGGSGQGQEVAQKTLLVASQPCHVPPSTPLMVPLEVEVGCIELPV